MRVTSAGNPGLSTPDGRTLDRALSGLDFMVSVDIYLNETTRHADLILPPTTGLETDHYDLAFHALAVRNTAKYSEALVAPSNGAMHDWEIFRHLRRRLESERGARPTGIGARVRALVADRMTPKHMLDLGPLSPRLPDRLYTEDHLIHLTPPLLVDDVERVTHTFFGKEAKVDKFDLVLIGRRHLRSNNSWMHNSDRLVKRKERCTALLHPVDAKARGLQGWPAGPGPLRLRLRHVAPGNNFGHHGWRREYPARMGTRPSRHTAPHSHFSRRGEHQRSYRRLTNRYPVRQRGILRGAGESNGL